MKWAVVVTGLGLVAWGGYLHWAGWLIVQVERGWSSVIAGAVFLAAGFVLLAIAAVMAHLEALRAALGSRAQSAAEAAARQVRQPPSAPSPEPPVAAPGAAGLKDATPDIGAPRRPSVPPPPPSPPLLRPEAGDARSASGGRAARSGPPEFAPLIAEAPPPKIIRRYQSQGVDYTLYEDGSIDAETGGERHRFGSIDELRDFLARQRP